MEPETSTSSSSSSVLLKKAKKLYNFHPPNMTPSLSTNKPRINSDDVDKLDDILVAVIGPHSGSKYFGHARKEYELYMEEQRVLHCFRRKIDLFNLLNLCLDGTLDEFVNRLHDIKANSGNNGDDRQDNRLLLFTLYDYYANCIKSPYIILPNEQTPFAEHII
ncbi:hypothetical protein BC941DRAFT_115444 [Chlamydoabsidia padenii]|nr:hypothetical protein BC941DRAFT_115444 [Chlamydoabsidia padenii]